MTNFVELTSFLHVPQQKKCLYKVVDPLIVIKFGSIEQVNLIFEHLINLDSVSDGKENNERICMTKHLPRSMQLQRKAMMAKFKKTDKRRNKQALISSTIPEITDCISIERLSHCKIRNYPVPFNS